MAANKKLTLELNTVVNDKIGEALKTLAADSSQVESKFKKTYEQTTKAIEAVQKFGKADTFTDLGVKVNALSISLENAATKLREIQKSTAKGLLGAESSKEAEKLAVNLESVTAKLDKLWSINNKLTPLKDTVRTQEGIAAYDKYLSELSAKQEKEKELLARNAIARSVTILEADRTLHYQRQIDLVRAFDERDKLLKEQATKEFETRKQTRLDEQARLEGIALYNAYLKELSSKIEQEKDLVTKGAAAKAGSFLDADKALHQKRQAELVKTFREHEKLLAEQAAKEQALAAKIKAANLSLGSSSTLRPPAAGNIPPNFFVQGAGAKPLTTPETDAKALEKLQAFHAQEQALVKANASTIKGIELRRDLEIQELITAHNSRMVALQAEAASAAARRLYQAKQEEIAERIRLEVQAADREIQVVRETADKRILASTKDSERFETYYRSLEARTQAHIAETLAIYRTGNSSLEAEQIRWANKERQITEKLQEDLRKIKEGRSTGDITTSDARNRIAQLQRVYREEIEAGNRNLIDRERLYQQDEDRHRRYLNNLRQATQASLAEEHAIHVHGDNSIEVERVRSAERQRQIQENLQRTIADIERRRQTGGITNATAINQSTQAYNAYSAAISATTRQLHTLEQASARAAENHRNLFLRVGEIISAYTIWNAVRANLWAGLQAIPNIGMALETTKSVLQTTMGGSSEAKLALKLLSDEAERTGINLNALRETWRNFSASTTIAGETVQASWNIFKNFNTVITSLHLSADKATGIFNALAQIFNKSKVQSEELVKQLGNLLPGAFAAFAKANNFATSDLIKKMKAGEVFAHDTIERFAKFYASTFTESFDLARNSLQANVGRMQNAWTELAETLYSQTSGSMVAAVKGLADLGKWLKEDAEGANVFGESVKVGVALGIGALGSLALSTQAVRNSWAAATATIGLMGTAIRTMAASSNIAMATMTVTANTLGAALKAAFASNWVTILIGGLAYAGIKLYELNQEAKAFDERIKAASKDAAKGRQIDAGTYTLEEEKADTFKTKIEDDEKLKEYLQLLEEIKNKRKDIGNIAPIGSGRQSAATIKARKELEELTQQQLDVEYNIARRKKQIRQEVDQVYIDQTKDTSTIVKRLHIERLQSEGKTLEAAKEQYQLAKEEEIATLNNTIDKLEKQEEAHLKRLKELRAIYKEDPTESNQGNVALEEQKLEQNLKEQRENKQAVLDYIVALDEAGKRKLLENETKLSNDRLSILKNHYKDAERLQKQHYETIKANLEAQQEELNFIQGIRGEALPELESISKKELLIQREILNVQMDKEDRLQRILDNQIKLNQATAESTQLEFNREEFKKEKGGFDVNFLGNIPPGATDRFEKLRQEYAKTLSAREAALEAANKVGDEFQVQWELREVASNDRRIASTRAVIQESTLITDQQALEEESAKRIIELETKLLDLKRQRKQAIIALLDETKNLEIQEAEARGELVKSGKLRAEQQYAEQERILGLIVKSEEYTKTQKQQAEIQLKIIGFLKERAAIQDKLTELQLKQNSRDELLSLKEQSIAREETRGNATSIDSLFARARAAKESLSSNNYEEQIKLLRDKFAKAGPGEKVGIELELERAQGAYDELKLKGEEVGNYFQNELSNMLVSPLTDFINGQKSAIESMKAFGLAFVEMIQKIIVQELALLAVKQLFQAFGFGLSEGGSLFGGSSSSSSSQPTPSNLGGQFSSFIPSRAAGGNVISLQDYRKIAPGKLEGDGTETSDSIKALAPNGSYVIKASSARKAGYNNLQQLIKNIGASSGNLLPVNVSRGEVLIPPNIVQEYGVDFFDRLNRTGEMRAEGGPIGSILNTNKQPSGTTTSNTTLIINVQHTGKESPEELGDKIGVAIMKKIATQEASRQIYLYDKSKTLAKSRKI